VRASNSRAARRADVTGTGPTLDDAPRGRYPGASGAFALLGEVLLVGVLVTLVSLPLVTLPAALAAGCRHLHRYLGAEDSRLALFWSDLRRGALGGVVVGVISAVVVAILLLDIVLAGTGMLPGGPVVAVAGWVGLIAVAAVLLTAARLWTPGSGWIAAVRSAPRALAADPAGVLYVIATAVFVAVVTWMLPPVIVPALGCAVLAVVAIPERRRARS
jgi:hypothetical protein